MVNIVMMTNIDSLFIGELEGMREMWYMFQKDEIVKTDQRVICWLKKTVVYIDRQLKIALKIAFASYVTFIFLFVLVMAINTTRPWVDDSVPKNPQWTAWGNVVKEIFVPIIGTMVPVLIPLIGWIMSHKKNQKLQDQIDKKDNDERYDKAIQQLKDRNQNVAIDSVQILHKLAENDPDYRPQVFESLCDFIREETKKSGYQTRAKKAPSPLIQRIIDTLFDDTKSHVIYPNNAILSGAFLFGANFENANLLGVDFQEADLREATLRCANLQEAKLRDAKLQEADLSGAKLQGAHLRNAKLHEAKLYEADFRGAQSDISQNFRKNIKLDGSLGTKLSGIARKDDNESPLKDDKGNELKTEQKIKAWFIKRGANVDDLTAEEVQEIFKDWK